MSNGTPEATQQSWFGSGGVLQQATSPAQAANAAAKADDDEITIQSVLGMLGQGAQLIKDYGSAIQSITGSSGTTTTTRCVLGEQVQVGLPDSDPNAWIGQPLVGIRIASLPDWLDVCTDDGYGAATALYGWGTLGLTSPQQWLEIARAAPMSGVAVQGTPFGELTPTQQRAYLANAAAIGVAQNVSDLSKYTPIWQGLLNTQADLGWLPASSPAGQAALAAGGADPQTGTPAQLGARDLQAAVIRLSGEGPSLIPPPPVEVFREEGYQNGMTQDPLRAACFAQTESADGTVDYPARQKCVRDQLASNSTLADFYAQTQDPWIGMADPSKRLQSTVGLDGRRYAVAKWGGELHGARMTTVLGVTALAGVGVVGGVIALTSKAGKRLRKKWFG
jgi:hypothetical protein